MAVTGDLGPAILNLVGVRGGDKNEMMIHLMQDDLDLDLSGMTLSAQARYRSNDVGVPPITAEVEIVDAPGGTLRVLWPGDQVTAVLNSMDSWKGVWDLQQVTGSDRPVTLLAGTFEANQDVTR